MSFTQWLISQRTRHDLVGELGQQVARREWPATSSLLAMRVRLALERASPSAFQALQLAWAEWEASKHLPSVNSWSPPVRLTVN